MAGFVVVARREREAVAMPVRRDHRTGRWFLPIHHQDPDGGKQRLFGTPGVPGPYHDLSATKIGAQEAEQRAIKGAFAAAAEPAAPPAPREIPTFHEWFTGRFWREWVVGRRNKPAEIKSKECIYEHHLKPAFGELRLDEIGAGEVSAFPRLAHRAGAEREADP